MISEFFEDNLLLAIFLFCYIFSVGYFVPQQYSVMQWIFLLNNNKVWFMKEMNV